MIKMIKPVNKTRIHFKSMFSEYENKLATTHNYFYILNTSNNLYSKEYDVINQISIETDEVIEMLKKHNFS